MNENKDCKIVQDLLPNYIEKLTNEETNKYIEEHLNECKECKDVLLEMQKELKISDQKRDRREVKYIKKFSNKMKILKIIRGETMLEQLFFITVSVAIFGIMFYKMIKRNETGYIYMLILGAIGIIIDGIGIVANINTNIILKIITYYYLFHYVC